jgi:hypothetical protein
MLTELNSLILNYISKKKKAKKNKLIRIHALEAIATITTTLIMEIATLLITTMAGMLTMAISQIRNKSNHLQAIHPKI